MKTPPFFFTAVICACALWAGAQSVESYEDESSGSGATTSPVSLLDPSRFTMQRSVSFGMSKAGGQSLQSQSLAATMLQYQLSEPVTLNLNFALPIHSTYNPMHNLNAENLSSADYLRSMPIEGSITWQPRQNLLMRLSISHNTQSEQYLMFPSTIHRLNDPFGGR